MINEQILGERKNDNHLPKIYGKLHGSEPNTDYQWNYNLQEASQEKEG